MAIDRRMIRLGIIIDNELRWYDDLFIEAKGVKFNTPNSGECDITILNLNREMREKVLTNTNPLTPNRKRVSVILEVGRESYGTAPYFSGDVFRSEPTGKPDIGIQMHCIVGFNNRANLVTRSSNEITKLSSISQWVAQDCGFSLSFEIPDKNVRSYSFTGSAFSQLMQLEKLANANVFVDNNTIYVTEDLEQRSGAQIRKVSSDNDLLQAGGTDFGVKAKFMFDPLTTMGSPLRIESSINPSINGLYTVYKLSFHVANRAQPFYIEAECGSKR